MVRWPRSPGTHRARENRLLAGCWRAWRGYYRRVAGIAHPAAAAPSRATSWLVHYSPKPGVTDTQYPRFLPVCTVYKPNRPTCRIDLKTSGFQRFRGGVQERVGIVFKTVALDHSATHPKALTQEDSSHRVSLPRNRAAASRRRHQCWSTGSPFSQFSRPPLSLSTLPSPLKPHPSRTAGPISTPKRDAKA